MGKHMAKIKFVRIIKTDIKNYQQGLLPNNAIKLKMPTSTNKLLINALPFAIPSFIVIFLSIFLKTYFFNEFVINPVYFLIGFAVGFLLLPAHELLHAIVYPNNANVSIGFILKSFAAVALVSFPLKKFRFIIMSLLPLVLGIVPIVMFICFPAEWIIANSIICGISVMGLISPYPDLYNVFQVLKQDTKNSYLQFHNDDLYYFIKEQ